MKYLYAIVTATRRDIGIKGTTTELTMSPAPLACVPGAIRAEERSTHFALIQRRFSTATLEREALPNGYAFRFAPEAIEEIARFMENERKCCPFLTFELIAPASADLVWLRMTGPEGTQAFLDAEFGI